MHATVLPSLKGRTVTTFVDFSWGWGEGARNHLGVVLYHQEALLILHTRKMRPFFLLIIYTINVKETHLFTH